MIDDVILEPDKRNEVSRLGAVCFTDGSGLVGPCDVFHAVFAHSCDTGRHTGVEQPVPGDHDGLRHGRPGPDAGIG